MNAKTDFSVGILRVVRLAGLTRAVAAAAACRHEDCLLVFEKTLIGCRVKRLACARDLVDVRLEDAGDAEVVHRDAENEQVRSLELADKLVGQSEQRVLLRSSRRRRRVHRADKFFRDVRYAIMAEIAVGDGVSGVGLQPGLDELARNLTRV